MATIEISDELAAKLREKADQKGISIDDLLQKEYGLCTLASAAPPSWTLEKQRENIRNLAGIIDPDETDLSSRVNEIIREVVVKKLNGS